MGKSCRFAALGANKHNLACVQRALRFHDTAVFASSAGLHMFGDHVAAFDDNLLLFGADLKNLTLLAVVFAWDRMTTVSPFFT